MRKYGIYAKQFKVHLFSESHKNLRNLPHGSVIYLVNIKSKGPNHEEDCENSCGFLRKAEL